MSMFEENSARWRGRQPVPSIHQVKFFNKIKSRFSVAKQRQGRNLDEKGSYACPTAGPAVLYSLPVQVLRF